MKIIKNQFCHYKANVWNINKRESLLEWFDLKVVCISNTRGGLKWIGVKKTDN